MNYIEEIPYTSSYEEILKSENVLSLIIKVTNDCNFRCIYCYENFKSVYMSVDEKKSILLFIKNQYKDKKFKNLVISWFGGEPLLNKKFIYNFMKELNEFCFENKIQVFSDITTNGYLLNLETVKKLIDMNVNNFQITIDGNKEIHDRQRMLKSGKGTFEKILENINGFILLNEKFNVHIRINIGKNMLGKLDDFYKQLSYYTKDDRFTAKLHTIVDVGHNLEHEVTDIEILEEMRRACNYGVVFGPMTGFLSIYDNVCYAKKDNNYIIEPNLDIRRCTMDETELSLVGKMNYSGNIVFNKNKALWDSYRNKNKKKCKNCVSEYICNGGICPLYEAKTGEPRCLKFKKRSKQRLLLELADKQNDYDIFFGYE